MSNDHEVGYRKPPVSTRFKPGQSGNKSGRPKGSKNIRSLIEQEANEKISIQEAGRTRKITKQQAIVKRAFSKALSGDDRAIRTILTYLEAAIAAPKDAAATEVAPADQEIIASFLKKMKENSDE